jgi:hypothetical protein
VVNGLRWIFSIVISPSSFSERVFMTLSVTEVCTCGSWITSAPANKTDATATNVSQSIFRVLLIMNQFILSNLQK